MKKSAGLAALLLASCSAERPPPVIGIENAWAKATIPGQAATALYFTLANYGGEDRLVAVSSPAGDASIHSTSMTGGVMRMRPVEALEVPADSTVTLKPGGTHVMLTGLTVQLAAGTTVPVDLRFERSGKRSVIAAVRPSDGAEM